MKTYWAVALVSVVAGFALGTIFSGETTRSPAAGSIGSQVDVAEGLESALAMPRGVERTTQLVAILQDLDHDRAQVIAAELDRDASRFEAYETRLFGGAWAEFAPETAFVRSLEWEGPGAELAGAAGAIEVWARNNPIEAREALASLPEGHEEAVGPLFSSFAKGWIDGGGPPGGLAPMLSQLKDWERERSTRLLIDDLKDKLGNDAAMRWADEIPRDAPLGFRNLAFRKISLVIGAEEPELVAGWLEAHREYRYGQAGFRILGRTWADSDPEAAIAWATDQPDDRARFLSIKFAFERWYENDPEAARQWLATMPDDGVADPAHLMVALVEGQAGSEIAVEASMRIRDPEMRRDTLGKTIRPWLDNDPTAAARWIAAAELDEAERAIVKRAEAASRLSAQRRRALQRGGQAP